MTYGLKAFGYELAVHQTQDGNWHAGYKEPGNYDGYTTINADEGFQDADSAKLAICRAVQALAAQIDPQAVLDPCKETLKEWKILS